MHVWQISLAAACALAGVLSAPSRVSAFGKEGHTIVGKVADQLLTRKARAEIAELLSGHQYKGLSDGRLTNFADAIRRRVAPVGGIDFVLPPRGPMLEPLDFK